MSNLRDITQPLADAATLAAMAKRAGITELQARAIAAMFADLPIRTAIRICVTAQLNRIRESERQARKKR